MASKVVDATLGEVLTTELACLRIPIQEEIQSVQGMTRAVRNDGGVKSGMAEETLRTDSNCH